MEVDTGASLSLISKNTYHSLWPKGTAPALHTTSTRLKSYTGDVTNIKGTIYVNVVYQEEKVENLPSCWI